MGYFHEVMNEITPLEDMEMDSESSVTSIFYILDLSDSTQNFVEGQRYFSIGTTFDKSDFLNLSQNSTIEIDYEIAIHAATCNYLGDGDEGKNYDIQGYQLGLGVIGCRFIII